MAWLALLGVLLFWFARQRSWGPRHQLALVAAALGTYAWLGFVLTSLVDPGDPVRWSGNIVFAAVALALAIAALRRTRTVTEQPRPVSVVEGSLARLWSKTTPNNVWGASPSCVGTFPGLGAKIRGTVSSAERVRFRL
jgi:hypothetical protein